ncbi:Cell division protein ZipN/Ftn2/Arc6, specific for cyanobacteria and chloroplast [uncultured Microcoleus sp.]|uniref:Cell division protein ZipN/Ftn2/Arc6, specific for cyanobacteria and chloroplast n=1 Tax=uncultured Microcoleus sp. TaxID=259945 RepID=A0A6J4PN94_9CYAN|nr:Cell division protein ZipN/Ftn2/Arc6, specific for cyanobacteria and chloroplast [uncultured Microcoleus sp.]
MLIPLDYYRILGLPIQATAEQLQQAHRDRTLQLPRREYSEVAIVARKQLLDEACAVLSDSDERKAYDASFLAKTYDRESEAAQEAKHQRSKASAGTATFLQDAGETVAAESKPLEAAPDPHTPSIEIDDNQFVGALLILQELGEYELVQKLGRPYLNNGSIAIAEGRFGDPQLVRPDIVLTVSLACLELGREQWQQGQYENAAKSLEAGQELLLRESLFPSVRGEMQADLYKLRPYNILELLSLPEEKVAERRKGLQILREMLQERGGIDGSGDDRSGLGIEDFLRFVQQMRKHLTSSEQQALFEAEAGRPSAVATYLSVYTLLAQGFAARQPSMIRRAKLMLMQLGRRQDVHLEKAVCSLLLGQTEEASRALELSSEKEPLAFIREHSQDSPDLLPGLCLYAEHWLQEEVFPHFRDLANQSVSLKDYFADPKVQAYLEALPLEAETANEWVVVQPRSGKPPGRLQATAGRSPAAVPPPSGKQGASTVTLTPVATGASTAASGSKSPATAAVPRPGVAVSLPTATARQPADSTSKQRRRKDSGRSGARGKGLTGDLVDRSRTKAAQISAKVKSMPRNRLALFLVAGVLSLLFLWLILSLLASAIQALSPKDPEPLVGLEAPPIEIPTVSVSPEPSAAASGAMTEEAARDLVQSWLSAKAAALGPNHAVEELKQVLTEPALSRWQLMAEAQQRNNAHQRYVHKLQVNGITTNPTNPDRVQVDAQVSEKAEVFDRDQPVSSRNENLRVRYDLIRQEGEWRIMDWQVIK